MIWAIWIHLGVQTYPLFAASFWGYVSERLSKKKTANPNIFRSLYFSFDGIKQKLLEDSLGLLITNNPINLNEQKHIVSLCNGLIILCESYLVPQNPSQTCDLLSLGVCAIGKTCAPHSGDSGY